MLKPDPNERATIPEIFNHPWVRAVNSTALPACTDLSVLSINDKNDNDDESFSAIQYSPSKMTMPGSSSFLQTDDDKLPFIVSRPSSRQDITIPTAVVAPSSESSSARSRPGKLSDNPLQSKSGSSKMEKASPRPMPITTTTAPKSTALSPSNASAKRAPAANPARARQRNGKSNDGIQEKSHSERGALHVNDDKLPSPSPQKAGNRRRVDDEF
jgi:hypothetical protein